MKDDLFLSLYLHIPFCEVKCGYCDFFSIPRGYEDFNLQKEYAEALIREIETRAPEFEGRPIRSIFFGGGTPSLLDPVLLERILGALKKYFSWTPEVELTLESNPKTVSLEKLKQFKDLGINRLSIGVQSFKDKFLKTLGRIHTGHEARLTVDHARKAGFENISIDLIYALPGQTFEEWKEDLEEAISLQTPHLSAYHLIIEEKTPFASLYKEGRLKLPLEEEGIQCLEWTRERLGQARLEPYEISNFSHQGRESIHNQNYWQYGDYLGLGTAAASFIRGGQKDAFGVRRTNVRNLTSYLEGKWEGFSENISHAMAMGEYCMLALRTREGMSEKKFQSLFGQSLSQTYDVQLKRWLEKGWLNKFSDTFSLTPSGILFADEVAVSFLS